MTDESQSAKVLIIEDEALIARELQHRLKSMGWDVVGTAFGEEAVDLALEHRPDLILSDINLRHGLSGIDVTRRIQTSMDVPVVFLTAYSDQDTVARAKSVTPFGYIIKPVDNRDLQITIEMALYKFRAEKELKEKQQLLETALACIGSSLFFVDESGHVLNANKDASELLGEEIAEGIPIRRLLGETHPAMPAVTQCIRDKALVKLSPFLMHRRKGSTKLVDGVVGPMDHGVVIILRDLGDIEDAVRQEPMEQYARLGADTVSPSESTFCQLLIAPDGVDSTAHPALLEEVRSLLDRHLRATDLISVFGQSLLSISLPYTRIGDGEMIASSLLARLTDFRFDGQRVEFSAGLANAAGGTQEPIELFQRATVALETARRMGGGQLWTERREDLRDNTDLGGASSYRQVVLLWNIMNTLSTAPDLDTMCGEFCRHLFHVFDAERVALLLPENQQVSLRTAYVKGIGGTEHISDLGLNAREFAVIQGVAAGEVKDQILHNTLLFNVADQWVLLLSGASLREDDHSFFASMCTYLAGSLARFAIVDDEKAAAIDDLSERQLIYASPEMEQVLETANLAAPTDATVLLFGESGTGKELVARHIHEQGHRREKPLVVVDCGAVSPSLIESELFGHVKGAFTGATANFKGRLKEANGGTVLLDEIGELPLDTQVKLLRFVQDRQLAPVGSNQYEAVDARVIAATHRDLKEMVDRGEFREDLYYRLNVFTVSVPPLRDREPDILLIAEHYLSLFAARYRKPVTGFSDEARRLLLSYDWPGNIRELSNVVNRAVILSKDDQITAIQLGLFGQSEKFSEKPTEDKGIRDLIRSAVDIGVSGRDPSPVGRYLEEDFILLGVNHHQGVLNRTATTISMPESTLRRKMIRIEEDYGSLDPTRPDNWPVGSDFYSALMQLAATRTGQPLDVLLDLLVEEIEQRNLNKTTSARLLGVSLPTYRKLSEEID